jgi:hypothetical protein
MTRQAFAYETGAGKMPHGVVVDPRVFVAIAPDGSCATPTANNKVLESSL